MEIELIRNKIDELDQEIMSIIKQRFQLVSKIALTKKKTNRPIQDRDREKQVLQNWSKFANQNNLDRIVMVNIAQTIIAESRNIQQKSKLL